MFSGPPLKQGVSYNFWTQIRVRKKRVFFHFDQVRYPPPMPVTLQKLKIVHNQRLATLTEFLTFSTELRIQTPESWFFFEKGLFSDSECVSNTPQQFAQTPLRQRLLAILNKRFSFYQKSEGEKINGGESEIRTRVRISPKQHFQCCAFNHSAISPSLKKI